MGALNRLLPSSSSHALIGGLLGAGLARAGTDAVVLKGVLLTTGAIVLSPLLGFALALLLVLIVSWLFFRSAPLPVDTLFRRLQFVSAALYSLGHGGNDAQKTMGIISVLLFTQGLTGPTFHVPLWVVLACHATMAAGTLFGGWRIVRTMGQRITNLNPVQGFCAEARERRRCSSRHGWAFPSPPPIRSPERSPALAPRGGCEPSGGTSPAVS